MVCGVLATQRDRASAVMVLAQFSRTIPISAINTAMVYIKL